MTHRVVVKVSVKIGTTL